MIAPRRVARRLLVIVVSVCASVTFWGQNASDPLKQGFENPPDSARPRVWWHWMNGNITKEGIKLAQPDTPSRSKPPRPGSSPALTSALISAASKISLRFR